MPKTIDKVLDYNLMQLYELIDTCAQEIVTRKGMTPLHLSALHATFDELSKMMSDPETAEDAARWFKHIMQQSAEKRRLTGKDNFKLFVIGSPTFLERVIRSNNIPCIEAIEQFLDCKANSAYSDNLMAKSVAPPYHSILDIAFLSGHFNLVKRILKHSRRDDVVGYPFPCPSPKLGVELQCKALDFLISNDNSAIERQYYDIKEKSKAHDYFSQKIHGLVSQLKEETDERKITRITNKLFRWANLDHNIGYKETLISIYNDLKDTDSKVIPLIITELRKKAEFGYKDNNKPFGLLYGQLKDNHKVIFLKLHFRRIPRDSAHIERFYNELNPDDQLNFAKHCDHDRQAIIPYVPRIPYPISSQVVTSTSNPYNYSLLHYWLIDKSTTEEDIETWLWETRAKIGFTDHRYNMLRDLCFYFRERSLIMSEHLSFFGGKTEFSKADKLEVVGKLMTKLLDPDARVPFTEKNIKALKQGRTGTIYNGYKFEIEKIFTALPASVEPIRLSMPGRSAD